MYYLYIKYIYIYVSPLVKNHINQWITVLNTNQPKKLFLYLLTGIFIAMKRYTIIATNSGSLLCCSWKRRLKEVESGFTTSLLLFNMTGFWRKQTCWIYLGCSPTVRIFWFLLKGPFQTVLFCISCLPKSVHEGFPSRSAIPHVPAEFSDPVIEGCIDPNTQDTSWLVVSTPLKNMKVSWDDYSQYTVWKNKKVPNHQPGRVLRLRR